MPDETHETPDPLYAWVINGDVLYTSQFSTPPTGPEWRLVVESEKPVIDPETQELAQIGWTITESAVTRIWQLLAKAGPNALVVTVSPSVVPQEVPMWALKVLITLLGKAADVDAFINGLPEPTRTVAFIQWRDCNFIMRSHPIIESLRLQWQWTPEQTDELFRQADLLK